MKGLRLLFFFFSLGASVAFANENVIKVAFIGPLSGPFALIGETQFGDLAVAMDLKVNSQGGVLGKKVELVKFDDQMNPKEATVQLKRALDQNIEYVFGGSTSATAGLINDAIAKHNKRNPKKPVMFIDYNAVDPTLTNKDCHFQHFALDAHVGMKMKALVAALTSNKSIKKVYIIGQDYAFGKAFSDLAKDFLKKVDPTIQIVGDELHPLGQVSDFSPYVSKIVKSGADAVMTGNFGPDMVRLAKALVGAGYKSPVYTFYAAQFGVTKALGKDAVGIVHVVHGGKTNPGTPEFLDYLASYRKKYPNLDGGAQRIIDGVDMWATAIKKAGNTNPNLVAAAWEGLEITRMDGEKVAMRKDDHLLLQSVSVSVHTEIKKDKYYDFDQSGFGLEVVHTLPKEETTMPTTCKMERPTAMAL